MGSRIGDEESVENRMDSTDQKPADVLTHSTSQTEFWRLLGLLGIRVTDGPLQGLSEGGCWRFIPALTYFSFPRSYSLGLL